MTREEVKRLTDEELMVAVAELCGWTMIRELTTDADRAIGIMYGKCPVLKGKFYVPRYPKDQNAMHDAERVFMDSADGRLSRYTEQLQMSAGEFTTWYATARQKAEAFVVAMTDGAR
jgi:hypothetical protein